jgi:hypothetical protein
MKRGQSVLNGSRSPGRQGLSLRGANLGRLRRARDRSRQLACAAAGRSCAAGSRSGSNQQRRLVIVLAIEPARQDRVRLDRAWETRRGGAPKRRHVVAISMVNKLAARRPWHRDHAATAEQEVRIAPASVGRFGMVPRVLGPSRELRITADRALHAGVVPKFDEVLVRVHQVDGLARSTSAVFVAGSAHVR